MTYFLIWVIETNPLYFLDISPFEKGERGNLLNIATLKIDWKLGFGIWKLLKG
jgi:hypothetical protein